MIATLILGLASAAYGIYSGVETQQQGAEAIANMPKQKVPGEYDTALGIISNNMNAEAPGSERYREGVQESAATMVERTTRSAQDPSQIAASVAGAAKMERGGEEKIRAATEAYQNAQDVKYADMLMKKGGVKMATDYNNALNEFNLRMGYQEASNAQISSGIQSALSAAAVYAAGAGEDNKIDDLTRLSGSESKATGDITKTTTTPDAGGDDSYHTTGRAATTKKTIRDVKEDLGSAGSMGEYLKWKEANGYLAATYDDYLKDVGYGNV